jgi:hypothetical protein
MPAPTITSLGPNSGNVGDTIAIHGSNLGSLNVDTCTIHFNGNDTQPIAETGVRILCAVPIGASTGPVTVTVNGQTSNALTFTVTGGGGGTPPSITSIVPASGPTGTSPTITGLHFGASQGISTVTFNGIAASVVSWSDTSIVVTVPGTATTGNVVVTVNGNESNAVVFTVTTPSNGGTQQPLNLFLILGLDFNTAAIWTLDPTNFDDLAIGGFYAWKVEDVIAGRTPTVGRIIISYRNFGVAKFTLALTGTDDSGNTVNNSTPVTVGTSAASGRICSKVIGLALTGQNLQVLVSRTPASGPLSITKVRLEGRVETTVLA